MSRKVTEKYTLRDLHYLVNRLRDPEAGCPWDIKQDYRTIIPHTLEEVYEVVDAIEREDYQNLQEELGDLLLQIMLYCQFSEEASRFALDDVISGLVAKLIRRHPHVFPDGTLESRVEPRSDGSNGKPTTETVLHNWEAIKAEEKAEKNNSVKSTDSFKPTDSILAEIPGAFPAMLRALKLQKKAAKVGFDWNSIDKVIEKLSEEVGELNALLSASDKGELVDRAAIESEVGDILFVCVNIARTLKIDPETALRSTNNKFVERFQYIERSLHSEGIELEAADLDKMEGLWQEAKRSNQSLEASSKPVKQVLKESLSTRSDESLSE